MGAHGDRGRLSAVTPYDCLGRVLNRVAYAYSPWGDVDVSWQSHGGAAATSGGNQSPKVQYGYAGSNATGAVAHVRLSSVTYPDGREVAYNYTGDAISDTLSRVASIGDLQSPYARFTYLGADMIVEVDHPAVTGGLSLSYGADGAAGLDALGRVVDQKWTTGEGETPAVVDRFGYTYDLAGNRLTRDVGAAPFEQDLFDEKYAYDALNRLTNVERGRLYCGDITASTLSQDWTLDAVGNWDEIASDPDGPGGADPVWNEREHDAANQITSIPGGITPAYDAAGNMTSGPKPGEAAGDGQTGQSYTYDAWNRLVAVEEWTWDDADEDGVFQAGEKSTAVPVAEYQYDGLNRRIARLVFDAPSDTWTRTDSYFNEDWQVLEERVATAVYAADKSVPATAPKVQYLWDPRYIDTPVCRWRDADPNAAGLEEVVYYTTDANHNVTAVLGYVDHDNNPATPKVFRVIERYVYHAYGTVTVLNPDWSPRTVNASALGNEVLFTGHPLDGETDLYYARARYLQPTLGIWLNPDPEGYTDGMNLYQYCGSNPIVAPDPMGLAQEWPTRPAGCPTPLPVYTPPILSASDLKWLYTFGKGLLNEVAESANFIIDTVNWHKAQGLPGDGLPGLFDEPGVTRENRCSALLDQVHARGFLPFLGDTVRGIDQTAQAALRGDPEAAAATIFLIVTSVTPGPRGTTVVRAGTKALSQTRKLVVAADRAALRTELAACDVLAVTKSAQIVEQAVKTLTRPELAPSATFRAWYDATTKLCDLTLTANDQLAADSSLARTVLRGQEYAAGQTSAQVSRLFYGHAVERIVERGTRQASDLSLMLGYVGGAGNPDFVGLGLLEDCTFDLTTRTPRQVIGHAGRYYEPTLILYERPTTFGTFP